jgi:hypothetical protein
MKELNLTQEPANDIGGGPRVAASPRVKASEAKARVMAVFENGVSPTFESFITEREDGHTCACAIGALAFSLGEKMEAGDKMNRGQRAAVSNYICGATSEFTISQIWALEEGFMGWEHGRQSFINALFAGEDFAETAPFYQAGKEIAAEAFGRV